MPEMILQNNAGLKRSGLSEKALALGLALLLGYLVLKGSGTITAASFFGQAVIYGGSGVLLGLWLVWRGLIKRAQWPVSGLEVTLGLAGLAGLLSSWASPDSRLSWARLIELVTLAALFYLVLDSLALGRAGLRRAISQASLLASGLALGMTLLEIYAHYLGHGDWLISQPLYRPVTPVGHANLLIGLANLALPLGLAEWRASRNMGWRTFLLIWGLSYGLIFPFASSRGGLVGLAALLAILGLGWLWPRRATLFSRRFWLSRAVLIGGPLTALIFLGLFLYLSLHPSHSSSLLGSRTEYWKFAGQIGAAHLWLGAGPGRFGFEVARYVSVPPDFWPMHAHSLVWQTFSEFGLLGLAALLALLANLAWVAIKRSGGNYFLLAALTGFLVHNLLDDLTHTPAITVMAAGLAALALSQQPLRRTRWPLAVWGLPLVLAGLGQGSWLWAYAAFDSARQSYVQGDTHPALALTRLAIQRDPQLSFYPLQAGLLTAQQGDWPAAQSYFEAVVSKTDTLAFVWANLGMARWQNGQTEQGLAALQQAAALAPRAPTLWLTAGWMAEAQAECARAETYYQTTLTLAPDWADHAFWQVTPLRQRVQAAQPPRPAEAGQPYQAAQAALTNGALTQAAALISENLSEPGLSPRQRLQWQLLDGDARLAQGQTEAALAVYRQVLETLAQPSLEGAGHTFWTTYSLGLYQRWSLPVDVSPGLRPLEATPEFELRFDRLEQALREQGDPTAVAAIQHLRQNLNPPAQPATACP